MLRRILMLVTWSLTAAAAVPVRANAPPEYTLKRFTIPAEVGGLSMTPASGINIHGSVSGTVCCQSLEYGFNNYAYVDKRGASTVRFLGEDLSGFNGENGWVQTAATGINDYELIVGTALYLAGGLGNPCSGTSEAAIFSATAATDLLGFVSGTCPQSAAFAINKYGDAVGWSSPNENRCCANGSAVLFHKGSVIPLAGGTGGVAYGINDAGVAIGQNGSTIAALFTVSTSTVIGTLGGPSSVGTALNNAGIAVGTSALPNSNIQHGFIYTNGSLLDIGVPAGANPSTTATAALAINNASVVVGNFTISGGSQHAFRYRNGVMHDLNALIPANSGWVLTTATGINDFGQVVGSGNFGGKSGQGFVLSPNAFGARIGLSAGGCR